MRSEVKQGGKFPPLPCTALYLSLLDILQSTIINLRCELPIIKVYDLYRPGHAICSMHELEAFQSKAYQQ